MKTKENFPIFKNNPELVYLDSAATTQKPQIVIDTSKEFYEKNNASPNRGVYDLSENATKKLNSSRKIISEFINSNENEIIFTKNATESINLIANGIVYLIPSKKDEILITEMEHHSNILPWQSLAKKLNLKLKAIKINENYELDLEDARKKISDKTAIIAFSHASNVLGTINPVEELIKLSKEKNILTVIDGTQIVPHKKIDVKNLGCDFFVFSSHKIFGPAGVGILYGKYDLLDKIPPFNKGGGIVKSVSLEKAEYLPPPEKFEAGTQNIAEIIAFAEAINFINNLSFKQIEKHEEELYNYAIKKLKKINNIKIYNPEKNSVPLISFNLENIHCHDIATILNDDKIAIRAGHHCAMPLMKTLKVQGTCRISLSIYNTKEDIDKLIQGLEKAQEVFKQ